MAKVQKVSTREFKEQAVQLAQTSGKPIAQVARELDISATSIHQWRKESTPHGKDAFPGSGPQKEARLALFTYLEVSDNRMRRHSTLGYVSPFVYEQRRR